MQHQKGSSFASFAMYKLRRPLRTLRELILLRFDIELVLLLPHKDPHRHTTKIEV